MKNFEGKVAFITGGASGAGFGQAQIFSEAGMKVVIADVNDARLAEAQAYFDGKGAPAHTLKLDVRDRDQWAAAAAETEKKFGVPDLLVLTAGVNAFGPAEATTYEDYDWIMGVCLGGVVNGLVTFVPRMIKAGGQRHIASTVSYGAFVAGATTAPYTAAKRAVLSLLESYWIALKPYNIGVTALCPANINSNIWEAALKHKEAGGSSGYAVTEKGYNFLASIHKNGMDPRVLAEWLKEAVENEQFLCLPYKHAENMVRSEIQRWIDYTTLGGQQLADYRQTLPKSKLDFEIMMEREGTSMMGGPPPVEGQEAPPPSFNLDTGGFGMASGDIDWVADNKKYK
ncbi:MAG: SDR family NAD(P)-dependent oxidoreductase [Oscillospiraceae bacterium]|jgi:NAD(P)-dependent dehydrogenase (short-subunit alcohol dehydrogenase family)|nr:SDR family NAD(P)-dependent oxidoreductase [Oscillospiraceae bacterium]